MTVELMFLSGSRQGQRLELKPQAFEIGDQPSDAVHFDPAIDPGIGGQRASFCREANGWRIRSTGTYPVFVNQDPVVEGRNLRSGDIVRMSERGPDFAFLLLSPREADFVGSADVEPAPHSAEIGIPPWVRFQLSSSRWPLLVALLMVVIVGGISAAWLRSGTSDALPIPPRLADGKELEVDEGQTLQWTPEWSPGSASIAQPVFAVMDAPPGLTLDPQTGLLRWTPTEAQGPGRYECRWQVTSATTPLDPPVKGTVVIQVREINHPPVLAPLTTTTVNLVEDPQVSLQVHATDSDLPAQKLTFRLGPAAPAGMQMDADTGRLTWIPSEEFANQEVPVLIQVSDDAARPLTDSSTLQVRVVMPDRWVVAQTRVIDSVYLLAARTPRVQSLVPLGSGCAIDKSTLLTTASIAMAIDEAHRRGWEVLALSREQLQNPEPEGLNLRDWKVHVGFAKSKDQKEKTFFDLALVTVDGQLPAACDLAQDDRDLVNGQQVGALGFAITTAALTRFDRPEPQLDRLELYYVIALDGESKASGSPLLLQLRGTLSGEKLGSPVINHVGEVVGIYGFQGELPAEVKSPPLHYAPLITVVNAWLAGAGKEHWVPLEPTDNGEAP